MNFEYTKPIHGTINNGTAGVVTLDGEIIADFIALGHEVFFAESVNGNVALIGNKQDVIEALS